jgi:hypothetical protein
MTEMGGAGGDTRTFRVIECDLFLGIEEVNNEDDA